MIKSIMFWQIKFDGLLVLAKGHKTQLFSIYLFCFFAVFGVVIVAVFFFFFKTWIKDVT